MADDLTIQKPAAEALVRVTFSNIEDFKARLSQHASEDLRSEVGGVLVGDVGADGAGRAVSIIGAIKAVGASAAHTHVTFTHESWDYIHGRMEAEYPGHRIVGWYHSHPGFGVFLSNYDEFICRSFFNLPWQVAVVVDPVNHEDGMFTWSGDKLVKRPLAAWDASLPTEPEPAARATPDAISEIVIATEDLHQESGGSFQTGPARDGQANPTRSVARGLGLGLGILLLLALAAGFVYQSAIISHLTSDVRSLQASAAPTTTVVPPGPAASEQTDRELAGRLDRAEQHLTSLDSAVAAAADSAKQAIARPPAQPVTTYVVQPGDSLWKIVNAFYGDSGWLPQIAALNGLKDPDRIGVGQKLWLLGINGED